MSPPTALFTAKTNNGSSSVANLVSASFLGLSASIPDRLGSVYRRLLRRRDSGCFAFTGDRHCHAALTNDSTVGEGRSPSTGFGSARSRGRVPSISRIFDGGHSAEWGIFSWTHALPAGTAIALSVRTGDTPTPDESWTAFQAVNNGSTIGISSRYLQYRPSLDHQPLSTPQLQQVTIDVSTAAAPTRHTHPHPDAESPDAHAHPDGDSPDGNTHAHADSDAADRHAHAHPDSDSADATPRPPTATPTRTPTAIPPTATPTRTPLRRVSGRPRSPASVRRAVPSARA